MNKIILQIQQALRDQADPVKADFFPHFFKSEPGDTDEFLGVTVPKQRVITKEYFKQLAPRDVLELLRSPVHEERLTALMIWVMQFKKGDESVKKEIYQLYLTNTKWVNNWDLVDASCRDIVGAYLFATEDKAILDTLSVSKNVWERRIAMVSTFYFIMHGDPSWTLMLAERYLHDPHHYIHKATGWMLREVGKRNDQALLINFLDDHAAQMPRTALRYAIEHLSPEQRAVYLKQK